MAVDLNGEKGCRLDFIVIKFVGFRVLLALRAEICRNDDGKLGRTGWVCSSVVGRTEGIYLLCLVMREGP